MAGMSSSKELTTLDAWCVWADDAEPQVHSFTWRTNASPEPFSVQSIDLVVSHPSENVSAHGTLSTMTWSRNPRTGVASRDEPTDIRTFLNKTLRAHNDKVAVKLIMAKVDGYVAQSNIIQTRFHGCANADGVASFLQPGERVAAVAAPTPERSDPIFQLEDILTAALGALRCAPSVDAASAWERLDGLEHDFRNRLSIQFLMPDPVVKKRVGLVQCLDYRMSIELLQHLHVELVVFDEPGTAAEDPDGPLGHLCAEFHPVDLTPDEGLVRRLYLATRDQALDALTSRFDGILGKVAQVAEMLQLPTPASSALAIATDKFLMRNTTAGPDSHETDGQAVCVRDRRQLEDWLGAGALPIPYPVVVKPTNGWGSYGVAKAANEAELLAAVEWAAGPVEGFLHPQVMIEPYCGGPEVDVNMALWNGEVTFADVSDNAPTAGDLDEVTGSGRKDFQECLFTYPSRLPASEQELMCRSMRDHILRMGFRSGVFHCEARVRHSAMQYVRVPGSGNMELTFKPSDEPGGEPSMFLLEVNARAPGYVGLYASGRTYGVDLWALQILHSLADEARFRALSVPFADGPQHHAAVLLTMPDKGGVLMSPDPMTRLQHERPELAAAVSLCLNHFAQGETVTSPKETQNCFTSVLLIESREGYEQCMRLVEEARLEWTPWIV